MRIVVCNELGGPDALVVEERDAPEPGPGQVRIAVRAAGVNYVDGLIAAGRYQIKIPPPFTPGSELAGVVDALGDGVDHLRVGDRVFASVGTGAFAERVVVRADQAVVIPDTLDFARAASFHQSYCTAWFSFTRRITVAPGEWVLVTGAGGGVGLAAIDVARSLGARVIGAASSAEKRALAEAAGAEATIDTTTDDVKVRARELSGGGVDIVYDAVGGDVAEPALRALGPDGRFLVIGFAGGAIPRIPLNLVLLNNRRVVGVDWGGWAMRNVAENRSVVDEVLAEIARGTLRPVAPTERPLAEAGAVITDLLERRVAGKVVLVP
ncbi:MAG TPA: NADPH:quinone oxidoreductase family protein [Acidimicrobiia bacterium]|nr:NADPH:quinone oxidoreductase family protein [Acidimicrobiia bacterium]